MILIQTYVGCRNISEVNRCARAKLLPVIRELAGFQSLSLVEIEDDSFAFILTFATRPELEAASQRLRQMVRAELAGLAPTPPEVLEGKVLWETRW